MDADRKGTFCSPIGLSFQMFAIVADALMVAHRILRLLGGQVQDFIKHFVREEAGVWLCVEPATLNLPTGRIQITPGSRFMRGTTFMGVELAKLLDEHYKGSAGS